MQCKTITVAVAVSGICCLAATASATQWYDFTLSGNDMMPTTLPVYTGTTDNNSPRDLGMFDGARRFKPAAGSTLPADMRTYRNLNSTLNFLNWYGTSTDRMAQFNLWGYGGADGYGWGEDFTAEAWGYNADSSSPAWDTYMSYDPDATGLVLNWWTSTGYGEGLAIGATDNPDFTFSLGLADDFNAWYNGQEGMLSFWFGGAMLDGNNQMTGTLQGNIILEGAAHNNDPVPEPATMLLFGTGIAGLLGLRKKKQNH